MEFGDGMPRGAPADSLRFASILVVVVLVGLIGLVSLSAGWTPERSGSEPSPVRGLSVGLRSVPSVATPNPYSNGMPAAVAVGQANLASGSSGTGPRNLYRPITAATFDSTGDLWVADTDNNRVLEYVPPFATGMSASLAIGQMTLSGSHSNTTSSGLWEPAGVTFDSSGDLWVADSTNNRVLEFAPPFSTGMSAKLVLGQASFGSRGYGTTDSNLTHPTGLIFNQSGDLFVADSVNNRVLAFTAPFTSGMAATLVLGQRTFTTSGSGTTATNLSDPTDVAVGPSGGIWVADSQNDRVIEYAPPLSDGMSAAAVLGEPNLTTRAPTPPYGLAYPEGLAFDGNGDLWVADSGNNRVVEYLTPVGTTETPTTVLGQTSFAGDAGGTTARNLSGPTIPAVDLVTGELWVEDSGNSRVVEYVPSSYLVTASETGLPGGTNWSVTFNGVLKSASAPAPLTFVVWNGTYPYSAGIVSGYSASPTAGTQPVNGTPVGFTITYTATSTSGGGTSGGGSWWWLILVLIVAVILILVYAQRRRRKRAPTASPPSGATEGSPTGTPGVTPASPGPPTGGPT